MRDTSVLLLVLILAHLALDYASSAWRARRGASTALVVTTAAVFALVMAGVLLGFGKSVPIALPGGLAIGGCWMLGRWVSGLALPASTAAGPTASSSAMSSPAGSGVAFVLQYAINLAALVAVWLTAEGYWGWVAGSWKDVASSHNLLLLLGYVLVLKPSSALIGAFLNSWLASVNTQGSLKSAGTLIGYLERVLILTFVLLEQWEAIGFLLTAKSILRFNDIKGVEQRSLSEYVLLGTLLSFTVSIVIGLGVLKLSGK